MPTKSKPIVIVVDDDQSTRRALRTQLRRAGFKVLEFDSAQKLLDTEFSSPGTCLLLNVHMPGMIDIELCEVLLASGREVPGVLMSAGAEDLRGKATGRAGAVSRRYKPFNEEALLRAVRKALRTKPK